MAYIKQDRAYIKRDLEQQILSASEKYPCLLLIGPRQVGKTTVLQQLMTPARSYVTLDEPEQRHLAQTDPALFLQRHEPPVLIDEVQYAPNLFFHIKTAIEGGAPAGSFWLTGSQAAPMRQLAQSALAEQVAILHLSALSQHEIYGTGAHTPFRVELSDLKAREQTACPVTLTKLYHRIWNGAMPGHISKMPSNWYAFYSSYLRTCIEQPICAEASDDEQWQFHDFICTAACCIGQALHVHDIAQHIGVPDETAKRWLDALEQADIIFYAQPYADALRAGAVQTPKLYFFDTGLVAYLIRCTSPEILQNGVLGGAILENYVVAEIIKSYRNAAQECPIRYYRDGDDREIDLILESDGQLHPLDIRWTDAPDSELTRGLSVLEPGAMPKGCGAVICMCPTLSTLTDGTLAVPIWMI
jgi:predicted AAA+ superfamily ATPase